MVVIFLYGVFFPSSKSFTGGVAFCLGEFLTFFGLIAVGIRSGGATTALPMDDLDAVLFWMRVPPCASFVVMDGVARPAGKLRGQNCTLASLFLKHRRPSTPRLLGRLFARGGSTYSVCKGSVFH